MKFAVLSDLAQEDLADIWVNIALDEPSHADRLIDELRAQMQRLAEQPMIGRARPELGKDVRSFPHAAYVVLYRPNSVGIGVARVVHSRIGEFSSSEESQYDLLRRLQFSGIVPREIGQLFGELRIAGNKASHEGAGEHRRALDTLRLAWQLGVWFHRTFGDKSFKSGPFVPPKAPPDESAQLRSQLQGLQAQVKDYEMRHAAAVRSRTKWHWSSATSDSRRLSEPIRFLL